MFEDEWAGAEGVGDSEEGELTVADEDESGAGHRPHRSHAVNHMAGAPGKLDQICDDRLIGVIGPAELVQCLAVSWPR